MNSITETSIGLHGTDYEAAMSIVKGGFRPEKLRWDGTLFVAYFDPHPAFFDRRSMAFDDARRYGNSKKQNDYSPTAVFEVSVPPDLIVSGISYQYIKINSKRIAEVAVQALWLYEQDGELLDFIDLQDSLIEGNVF